MMDELKKNVSDWNNEEEVKEYLAKILRKEVGDKSGLIYGMGHAVYTLSDPRAVLLKEKAKELAVEKGRIDEYNLYSSIEKFAPEVFSQVKGSSKDISANVDFYSGFVYSMMNIPPELYTPLFAVSRVVGWCAHQIEEQISVNRIMRPAYKGVVSSKKYIPLVER
jgi:citrate synthase